MTLRRDKPFTFCELVESSPLTKKQAREALSRMVESERLEDEDRSYKFPSWGHAEVSS